MSCTNLLRHGCCSFHALFTNTSSHLRCFSSCMLFNTMSNHRTCYSPVTCYSSPTGCYSSYMQLIWYVLLIRHALSIITVVIIHLQLCCTIRRHWRLCSVEVDDRCRAVHLINSSVWRTISGTFAFDFSLHSKSTETVLIASNHMTKIQGDCLIKKNRHRAAQLSPACHATWSRFPY